METCQDTVSILEEGSLPNLISSFLPCLPGWMRVVNRDGRVLFATHLAQRDLGIIPQKGCCESLGIPHRDEKCISQQTIATGQPQRQQIHLGRYTCQISSAPLRNDENEIIGSVEILQDTTELRRLQRTLIEKNEVLQLVNESVIELNHDLEAAHNELEEKNEELSEANAELRGFDQLKDEFISMVSHELRAPLTSMKGSISLMLNGMEEALPEKPRQFLDVFLRNTDRLIRMVNELLDLTRIESGRLVFHFETFPLEDLVQEVAQSLQALAQEQDTEISVDAPSGVLIEANRDRLAQVLTNLITNALKHSHGNRVSIHVSRQNEDFDFQVADNGIGISPDKLERIFEKFAQENSGRKRRSDGLGLGLSITRAIVEEHGGIIRAENIQGNGSLFRFKIPQPPGKKNHETHSAD